MNQQWFVRFKNRAIFALSSNQTPKNMGKILLIETATEVCSTAIAVDGQVIAVEEMPDCPKHTAVLPLQIQQCLQQAGLAPSDLDAVAVSSGPGSYTMLRTGVSLAKGMCYALGKPLIAVNTLQSLAWSAAGLLKGTLSKQDVLYMPMLDARRNEVWTALYDGNLNLLEPDAALVMEHNLFEAYVEAHQNTRFLVVSGNGMSKISGVPKKMEVVTSVVNLCSSRYLAVIAEQKLNVQVFENIADFTPFYMKNPNITTSVKFI